jgi:hypothetical protein
MQVCPDDAVDGLSSAPAPGHVAAERHLLNRGGEKVPELDGLPSDAVGVSRDAEGDFSLILAKVVLDVVGAEVGVASGAGRDEFCCAAEQLGNVHGHILGRV